MAFHRQGRGALRDDPHGDLASRRPCDDGGFRVDAYAQAVLAHERAGEGVVGGDGDPSLLVEADQAGAGQAGQARRHPLVQLGGGPEFILNPQIRLSIIQKDLISGKTRNGIKILKFPYI